MFSLSLERGGCLPANVVKKLTGLNGSSFQSSQGAAITEEIGLKAGMLEAEVVFCDCQESCVSVCVNVNNYKIQNALKFILKMLSFLYCLSAWSGIAARVG